MAKKLSLFIIIVTIALQAQLPKWHYIKEIKFPQSDSAFAVPFLCTVTENGRLYVLSSTATTIGAHNAIYYADSTDTVFTAMIDFFKNGESDSLSGNIGTLRGIAHLNEDIIVNASVPFTRSKPNTVSSLYYFPAADTNQVKKFGFYFPPSNPGHGTYTNGLVVTKDTFAIMGVTAGAGVPGPRARFFNLTNSITSPVQGAWYAESELEAGGAHSGGIDVIRDVAVVPGGNYDDSTLAFYTSRNSQADDNITGGISSWIGGTQRPGSSPGVAKYVSQRVSDFDAQLATFSTTIPYGITVDKNKRLWVAGTDSLRRWVKAFDVVGGSYATHKFELPSLNSAIDPNPDGAPFRAPSDVALTKDGLTAYVVDIATRSAFQFKFGVITSVNEDDQLPSSFVLLQNYPNPFNPSTFISYELARPGNVRLTVTNALGQTVATVTEGYREAGRHNDLFNAVNLTTGVYFYTLATPSGVQTKKMLLMK